MRLLVLGGTGFVGRAVAEEARRRGWRVTVFNRGTRPAPAGVERLRGDRRAGDGLAALRTGEWDLAVDTWSGAPMAVRDTARLLRDRVRHYTYVSSCSVYAPRRDPASPLGWDEGSPLVDGAPDAGSTDYAADKRGGEQAATDSFEERALLVRAGLVLGPHEDVDRLPWWLERLARGGTVLAPGPRDLALQYVDVRDLAGWTLDAAARRLGGPYIVVSPSGQTTMGELLDLCVRVTGSAAVLRWTPPQQVLAARIEPWTELPLWLPPDPFPELYRISARRAIAEGLRCRPVRETVEDTWAWVRAAGPGRHRKEGRATVGLDPRKEAVALRGGAPDRTAH